MQLSIENLRRLDPKDIGNWPAPIQIVVFVLLMVVVVVGGYFALLDGQRDLLKSGQVKEEELKQAFLDKKVKAINLDAYKQQLAEIQQTFGSLLKQLPSKAEMETLVTEINQSGVGRGLQFLLFKPFANEVRTAEFAERGIDITIIGTYHDLAAFASDIAQLSRIVTLSDITLTPPAGQQGLELLNGGGGTVLQMTAIAKTYRALDQEEAVAMKKDADKKKKP